MSSTDFNQKLKLALSQRKKQQIVDTRLKLAAVLIPMYYQESQYHIVFTKRTELMRYHKGEISFPGGGYHQSDQTLLETALRESFEEIGLISGDVEILGELDDIVTATSNYIVTPFVAFIPSLYHFTLSSMETEQLVIVPLLALLDKVNFINKPYPGMNIISANPFYYCYQGTIIKGATAKMLKQFLDIIEGIVGSGKLDTTI